VKCIICQEETLLKICNKCQCRLLAQGEDELEKAMSLGHISSREDPLDFKWWKWTKQRQQ